jgi:hypothetical protein
MNLIQRLPKDIQLYILQYTYQPQSKRLLNDIEHYTETKIILFDLYHDYWEFFQTDSEEYKHWLMNDIIAYLNHQKPTTYGYVYHFYTIFGRNNRLKTIECVDMYVEKINKKHVNTQINLFLGILNRYERDDLVNECCVRLV